MTAGVPTQLMWTLMKSFKVEFTVKVPGYTEWRTDSDFPGFKCIDPGNSHPFIYVPEDAKIIELAPPISDGIFVTADDDREIYKKSMGLWYYWSPLRKEWDEVTHLTANNERDFFDECLVRLDG